MTLTSKQSKFEDMVTKQLDDANASISKQQRDEISAVRQRVMLQAAQMQANKGNKAAFSLTSWLGHHKIQFATPVALAVALTLYIGSSRDESIPMLPAELLVADLPSEDLALLEDLEFANWLAQQQNQEVSL